METAIPLQSSPFILGAWGFYAHRKTHTHIVLASVAPRRAQQQQAMAGNEQGAINDLQSEANAMSRDANGQARREAALGCHEQ